MRKLRKATHLDKDAIWSILQQGIEQRRLAGSQQWQDGYPNEQTVVDDLAKGYAYVLCQDDKVVAYAAVIFDGDPAYADIQGAWQTQGAYLVLHRIAVADEAKGKGIALELMTKIELLSVENKVFSIRADTNHDNLPMIRVFQKLGYTYCGEVMIRGNPRQAYERVLTLSD
jgi:ribosomal protein S18 acetylase RimI-like enzyme